MILVYTCSLGLKMFKNKEGFYASLNEKDAMRNAILVNKDRIAKYYGDNLVFIDMEMIL